MGGVIFSLVITVVLIQFFAKIKREAEAEKNKDGTGSKTVGQGSGGSGNVAAYGGSKKNAPAKVTQKSEAPEEGSVTEYLRQKAEQDQIEHQREKKIEDHRLQQYYGCGCPPAERYLIGDPIPEGKHLVYCPYCKAENLVKFGEAGRKACYFCREALHG